MWQKVEHIKDNGSIINAFVSKMFKFIIIPIRQKHDVWITSTWSKRRKKWTRFSMEGGGGCRMHIAHAGSV